MHIEMTDRLAETIMEVQDVCNKHGLDIMDLPCGAMWMELVGVAFSKVTKTSRFNVQGCQSGRVSMGDPNIISRVQGFS